MKNSLFILLLCILLCSCVSTSGQIEALLKTKDYKSALLVLEENEVPSEDPSTMDEDLLHARNLYTSHIEAETVNEAAELLDKGYLRTAVDLVNERASLCAWSSQLDDLKFVVDEKSKRVREFLSGARKLLNQTNSNLITPMNLLVTSSEITLLLEDNEPGKAIFFRLANEVSKLAADRISSGGFSGSEVQDFVSNFTSATHCEHNLISDLDLLVDFYTTTLSPESSLPHLISHKRLFARNFNFGKQVDISPIVYALSSGILNKLSQQMEMECKEIGVRPAIDQVEKWYEEFEPLRPYVSNWLADLHYKAALLYDRAGIFPIIGLAHLHRGVELAADPPNWIAETRQLLSERFSRNHPIEKTIIVDTNPTVDPQIQEMVKTVIIGEIIKRTQPWVKWSFEHYTGSADIRIDLHHIEVLVPSKVDLDEIDSKFTSHFEQIPNPLKSSLEFQITLAKSRVSSAESSLDWAITSHNINPTTWSLSNVNLQRTSYNSAINYHNSLVGNYNSTPSTITRPVNLSYSFVQGMVRHGFRVGLEFETAMSSETFSFEDIDQDFVRFGTKASDLDSSFRRDNGIDIEIGVSRLLDQISGSLRTALAAASDSFNLIEWPGLSSSEEDVLVYRAVKYRLHPFFGKQKIGHTGLSPWLVISLDSIILPSPAGESDRPDIEIIRPESATPILSVDKFYQDHAGAVCLIESATSRGSGALISSEGHILTCAHVVEGNALLVSFPQGVDDKKYPAEVISADAGRDLAIIKIELPSSDITPFVVNINSDINTGTPIVALGNPLIRVEPSFVGSTLISEGLVSKAFETNQETPWHVIDITVSSGSSGGPVILKSSGEIIGVITAVLSPEYSENFASSGGRVLAAPTQALPPVLNFSYIEE